MKRTHVLCACWLASAIAARAQPPASPAVDRLLDKIVEQERAFVDRMKARAPLIETYVQETAGSGGDALPDKDHYFLGRFRLGETVAYEKLIERTDPPPRAPSKPLFGHRPPGPPPLIFLPRGFAQMTVMDLHGFNRANYNFEYAGREFLGEVRCLVFDVSPRARGESGRFTGRVWVEERDDNVVRFDGTYVGGPVAKGTPPERYFHFDSWRINVAAGEWVPFQIYVEEEGPEGNRHFKAQSRIWDYNSAKARKLDELTSILVDRESGVQDQAPAQDLSPLESQRSWEKQAEDNIVTRLEEGGLLAPSGPVDEVLNAVVNNLIVSAGLNVEARCRVLLTTPIETFSIGHTIVISRGLIDVLPDEASLALVLAAELSHIALGHRAPTQFAFHTQIMFGDAELMQRFHFERSAQEMDAAAKKTIEITRASPYQKTAGAGLFLKALASHRPMLPRLLAANLGNQVANREALSRLSEFAASAPALEEDKIEQIAALPLGSRVKLNPWTNQIELVKTKPLELLSPREKMPFEITPFVLHLTRVDQGGGNAETGQP